MAEPALVAERTPAPPGNFRIRELWGSLALLPCLALALLTVVVLGAIVLPIVDSVQLVRVDLTRALIPPIWAHGGTWTDVLGTDQLGRDILQRLARGARVSLLVALTAALAASLIGTVVGLISGYSEGWGDIVLSRVIEAQLSLPVILVALSIAISLGPSFRTTVLAIAITSWVPYARVVRSEVLVLKRSDFTALAIVTGLRSSKILWRHILPNVLPSVVVLATQNFGHAIVYEAGLSFLGIGVQPPDVSWGLMIGQSYLYIISVPWLVLAPAFALALTALSTNLLGDIIRDRLDPTLSSVQ